VVIFLTRWPDRGKLPVALKGLYAAAGSSKLGCSMVQRATGFPVVGSSRQVWQSCRGAGIVRRSFAATVWRSGIPVLPVIDRRFAVSMLQGEPHCRHGVMTAA
jgi:hypothetical protein